MYRKNVPAGWCCVWHFPEVRPRRLVHDDDPSNFEPVLNRVPAFHSVKTQREQT
jgi:hypothetical protein